MCEYIRLGDCFISGVVGVKKGCMEVFRDTTDGDFGSR